VKLTRLLVWTVVVVLVAVAAVVWLSPRWLGSDQARAEIERQLSAALGRPVTVGELVVEGGAPRVELRDVVIAAAPALSEHGPLMEARTLVFDIGVEELTRGRVVGTVVGQDVTLHIVREHGQTSLQGLATGRPSDAAGVQLDLAVEIQGAKVVLLDLDRGGPAQPVTLEGVDLTAVLSNQSNQSNGDKAVGLQVTIEAVEIEGVAVRNLMLSGSAEGGAFVVHRLRADLGDTGKVEGRGRFDPGTDGADWWLSFTLRDVALDGPIVDAAARLYPPLALPAGHDRPSGSLAATATLSGQGLHKDTILPSLAGEGTITLRDVVLPQHSLVASLAALAGAAPGPLALPEASARFSIADGWISLLGMESSGAPFDPHVRGRVGLDGRLELTADLMPLVEVFGGGIYAAAARYTTSIPVAIEGTVEAPRLRPPAVSDVARGLMGGLIRRAVTEPSPP
jgi:hypothetical protein